MKNVFRYSVKFLALTLTCSYVSSNGFRFKIRTTQIAPWIEVSFDAWISWTALWWGKGKPPLIKTTQVKVSLVADIFFSIFIIRTAIWWEKCLLKGRFDKINKYYLLNMLKCYQRGPFIPPLLWNSDHWSQLCYISVRSEIHVHDSKISNPFPSKPLENFKKK